MVLPLHFMKPFSLTFINRCLTLEKALRGFLLILIFSLNLPAFAQEKQGANWLFGGDGTQAFPGIHLNFNDPKLLPIPFDYDYNRGGGVATISDKNGELLFFSSWGHVSTRTKLNNEYQQMPNGNVFGGFGPGTYAELIIQHPQNENKYLLFIITLNLDLYVAEVNMLLNNGLGDLVPNSLRLLKKMWVKVWLPCSISIKKICGF